MIQSWIDLTELGSDPWVLPIHTAINRAVGRGVAARLSTADCELGLFLTTRLNVIPRVVRRVAKGTRAIERAAQRLAAASHQSTAGQLGVALTVNHDLKYGVIADVQYLLMELEAAREQMRAFAEALHAHAGKPLIAGAQIMPGRRGGSAWIGKLDRDRNFVAHKGALYLAIDTSDPNHWTFFLRKNNNRRFRRTADYFHFNDLRAILDGFSAWKRDLQAHLVDLFDGL